MSKAFTKESDGDDDEQDLAIEVALPGGFTNYITPAGHKRLNDELERLWKVDRPKLVDTIAWAASNGDRSENGDYIYGKRKLREIDRRIRFLSKRLDCAVVVRNAGKTHERVYFGAMVTVADESGVNARPPNGLLDRILSRWLDLRIGTDVFPAFAVRCRNDGNGLIERGALHNGLTVNVDDDAATGHRGRFGGPQTQPLSSRCGQGRRNECALGSCLPVSVRLVHLKTGNAAPLVTARH